MFAPQVVIFNISFMNDWVDQGCDVPESFSWMISSVAQWQNENPSEELSNESKKDLKYYLVNFILLALFFWNGQALNVEIKILQYSEIYYKDIAVISLLKTSLIFV